MTDDNDNEDNGINSEAPEILEVRIFLIGSHSVGKRSIARRFRILNTTKTLEDTYFISPLVKEDNSKDDKKSQKNEKDFKALSSMDPNDIRSLLERQELMKFSKVIDIEKYNITFNFFPITEAEKVNSIEQKDFANEEDEDYQFESEYHLSLKNVKKEILGILTKPTKSKKICSLEYIFLFCFDLRNYQSFEQMQIYFDQLDKALELRNHYSIAVIGNKSDHTEEFTKEQNEEILNFLSKKGTKYYKISTLMCYNFEDFFERLFKDLIAVKYEGFNKQSFYDRLHLIISKRSFFAKAERETFKFSKNPGPGEYLSNVYDYPKNPKEFKKTFTTGRFATKIFIGKEGPVFPAMNKDQRKIDKKDKKAKIDQKAKTQIGFGNWESKNKQDIKDALEGNVPGYSLGTKKGNYDFKKERKEKYKKQIQELDAVFFGDDISTLHVKKPPKFKDFKVYEENRKDTLNLKATTLKEKEESRIKMKTEVLRKIEEERKKKVEEIEKRERKYAKQAEIERQKRKELIENRSRAYSSTQHRAKTYPTPGPNAYDIRGVYDPKKGFSFGLKCTAEKQRSKNDPYPDFPNFKSDFEIAAENPKFPQFKRTAPRFKEPKIYEPVIPEKLEPLESRTLYKTKFTDKDKVMQTFYNERQKYIDKVQQNKEEQKIKRQQDLDELIEKVQQQNNNNNTGDYYINNINYNLVEDRAPEVRILIYFYFTFSLQ